MTITNKLGLPEGFVRACETTAHNRPGHVSATTLLKGTKEIVLTQRHWDELEDDVADRVWAIWGSAVHSLLEHETPDTFTEEYVEARVDQMMLTGRMDCYDAKNEILYDYKTASVWKVLYKDFEDWRKQGLIYAWLLNKNGFNVKKCRFIAMLKDHSKSKAKIDRSYPQSPVYVYEFDVTEKDLWDIQDFIQKKVKDIQATDGLEDDEIQVCGAQERWAKATTWAVMKNGRKSAIRVLDNKADAYKLAAEQGAGCYVEERKGSDGKCPEYCACCEFCNYWKANYGESGK